MCSQLEGGQFLAVRPVLMKRQKSSFHTLPCGVDVILGINGYIWLSPPKDVPSTVSFLPLNFFSESLLARATLEQFLTSCRVRYQETAAVVREKIARVRNAIEVRSALLTLRPADVAFYHNLIT